MKLGLRRLLADGEFSWPDIPGPEEFLEGPFDPDRTCPLDGRRGLSALVATDPPTAAELRPWADALPDADAMDDLVAELEELLPRYAAEAYIVECSELPCILGVPLDHDALEEGPPSLVIARALGRLGFEPMRRSPSPTIDEPTDWGRYSRVAPDEALLFVAPVSSGASPPPVPDALAQRLDARAITLQLERTAEATGPDGPCAAYSQVLSEEMWDSAP